MEFCQHYQIDICHSYFRNILLMVPYLLPCPFSVSGIRSNILPLLYIQMLFIQKKTYTYFQLAYTVEHRLLRHPLLCKFFYGKIQKEQIFSFFIVVKITSLVCEFRTKRIHYNTSFRRSLVCFFLLISIPLQRQFVFGRERRRKEKTKRQRLYIKHVFFL